MVCFYSRLGYICAKLSPLTTPEMSLSWFIFFLGLSADASRTFSAPFSFEGFGLYYSLRIDPMLFSCSALGRGSLPPLDERLKTFFIGLFSGCSKIVVLLRLTCVIWFLPRFTYASKASGISIQPIWELLRFCCILLLLLSQKVSCLSW